MPEKVRPIGVFDSGVGGLTVVREISRQLPGENVVYFGDTARVPYGTKSGKTVERFSMQNTRFLLSKKVKLIIVACNTASSLALHKLKKKFSVPIIGVIDSGVNAALKENCKNIGVIGTEATVRCGIYEKKIIKMSDGKARVFSIACPLFVPLIEEGLTEGEIADAVAERYLKKFKLLWHIDALILGCTHYPLMKKTLRKILGGKIILVDSAKELVSEVKSALKSAGTDNPGRRKGRKKYFVSDQPDKFRKLGRRFLGKDIENVSWTDIERY